MLEERVKQMFADSIAAKQEAQKILASEIVKAASILASCVQQGHKILACGNGGSASDAQHFAAEIVGRFERERAALPAIALTTDSSILTAVANDYGYEQVFARQIKALGQTKDVLLAISTSGNSTSIINAIQAAQARQMICIALSGRDGGQMADLLNADDIELRVPHQRTARIQEVHILILHSLCDLIDYLLVEKPE